MAHDEAAESFDGTLLVPILFPTDVEVQCRTGAIELGVRRSRFVHVCARG